MKHRYIVIAALVLLAIIALLWSGGAFGYEFSSHPYNGVSLTMTS